MPDGTNYGSVSNPPNPKQRYGDLKPDLSLVPAVAIAHEALAFEQGADKYGPYNWRDKAVEARTYVAANIRHVQAWLDGEEYSADSVAAGRPIHNLAHARACLGILLDCIEQGNLIDNRPLPGMTSAMHERVKAAREGKSAIPPAVELGRVLPRRPPAPPSVNQAQMSAVKVAWGRGDPGDVS